MRRVGLFSLVLFANWCGLRVRLGRGVVWFGSIRFGSVRACFILAQLVRFGLFVSDLFYFGSARFEICFVLFCSGFVWFGARRWFGLGWDIGWVSSSLVLVSGWAGFGL